MNKRKFVFVVIILIGTILSTLTFYQIMQESKGKEDNKNINIPEGKIQIEKKNEKSFPSSNKPKEEFEFQSIPVFYKEDDPNLNEDLINLLYEYGEGEILLPAAWEENKEIFPEEGINKAPGYFDNPDFIRQKLKEALSSKENFEAFEAYQLGPNINIIPIIILKTLKEELSDEPEDMLRVANEFFKSYYPRARLKDIKDIENFTAENIQPFEILIDEKDVSKLEEKIDELSNGISHYLKEKDPTSETNEKGQLFSFHLEEDVCFPNGRFVPEEKKYMIVAGVSSFDEKASSFLIDHGFGTE